MSNKAIEDFIASRNILNANIRLFHEGNRDLYRVVAGELRKLLCDGKNGENSLVPRLFPSARLHPLRGQLPQELRGFFEFSIPSMIEFDGQGGSRIIELFDKTAEPLLFDEWLSQELFNKRVTIRELIRSVADKESAHADKQFNDTLHFTRSIKLVDEDLHKQHIVAIGEYVLEILNGAIESNSNLRNYFRC